MLNFKNKEVEFIKKHFPNLHKQYKTYKLGWKALKVGTRVRTLCGGFGGDAGVIRTVGDRVNDGYEEAVFLYDDWGRRYLLHKNKRWWSQVEILEE